MWRCLRDDNQPIQSTTISNLARFSRDLNVPDLNKFFLRSGCEQKGWICKILEIIVSHGCMI